jgi:hypothetical protein
MQVRNKALSTEVRALKEAVQEWQQTAAVAVEERDEANKREKMSRFAAVAGVGAVLLFSALA